MKKRIFLKLVLICVILLASACQNRKEIPKVTDQQKQQEETEEEPDVRAAFTEKVTSTEFSEENVTGEAGAQAGIDPSNKSADPDGTYNYIALGNSVTCSKVSDGLWWGDWGMAATSADRDYVHLLSKWLRKQFAKPIDTMILNLKKWEVAKERDKILKKYGSYLNEDTDLVTIQTGENITDHKETLDADYLNLVKFIQEKAPNARILMLGELLWPTEDIEAAKKAACEAQGIVFVDVEEFLRKYEEVYRSSIGAKVSGEDGKQHEITDEVVAAHPNDKGMACIARLLKEQILIQDN